MSITAGAISLTSKTPTTVSLKATAATGGTGPYTYQWYKSQTSGFTPGGGNIISGATSLTLSETGLIPNVTWYYKLVATDTGHSNDTVEYSQLAVSLVPVPNPNQFAELPQLGMIDQRFDYDTIPVQIDASQSGSLFAGSAVKMVDSADGIPKVVGCDSDSDNVLGFINYDIKTQAFVAGSKAEISMGGNVIYLYASGAIARGAQVCLDTSSPATIITKTSGKNIVGWAFDKSAGAGSLIRVFLTSPSFTTAS